MKKQKTLAGSAQFSGIALHTGVRATLRITPAPVNTGILFCQHVKIVIAKGHAAFLERREANVFKHQLLAITNDGQIQRFASLVGDLICQLLAAMHLDLADLDHLGTQSVSCKESLCLERDRHRACDSGAS